MSNTVVERIKDSVSGETFEVIRNICNYCKNPIYGSGHASCLRAVREEDSSERERQRQKSCMEQFGQVLSPFEQQRRLYPDHKVEGAESYSDQLKREAEEKLQEHYRMMAQRDEDVRRLEWMEGQIAGLRAKVTRDKELAAEEAVAKDDNIETV